MYEWFLYALCVIVLVRTVLLMLFTGTTPGFGTRQQHATMCTVVQSVDYGGERCECVTGLFDWTLANGIVAALRDGIAVFLIQESAGVDSVRRTGAFMVGARSTKTHTQLPNKPLVNTHAHRQYGSSCKLSLASTTGLQAMATVVLW